MIADRLATLPLDTVIIHGACQGADMIADEEAKRLGLAVLPFPAEWDFWRARGNVKAAGPIRNKRMLDEGKPDRVWAFHKSIRTSRGTINMIRQAQAAGVPVELFGSKLEAEQLRLEL